MEMNKTYKKMMLLAKYGEQNECAITIVAILLMVTIFVIDFFVLT